MTKMLRITQDTKNLYGWIDHGHLELEVEKEKWDKMTLKRRKTYFERHAEMIIDDYNATHMYSSYDGGDYIYVVSKENDDKESRLSYIDYLTKEKGYEL